jgi:hypothetical protein
MQETGYNQRKHNTQEYTRKRPRPMTKTTRNTELKVEDTHKNVEKYTDEDNRQTIR